MKMNGDERTTYKDFIPKKLQGKSYSATDENENSEEGAKADKKIGEDQVVMFDVDIQIWRSCKYSSILQLRVRLHPDNTSPGLTADFSALCDENNSWRTLGRRQEVVFTDRQFCQKCELVAPDQKLASEQQPDTRYTLQKCTLEKYSVRDIRTHILDPRFTWVRQK